MRTLVNSLLDLEKHPRSESKAFLITVKGNKTTNHHPRHCEQRDVTGNTSQWEDIVSTASRVFRGTPRVLKRSVWERADERVNESSMRQREIESVLQMSHECLKSVPVIGGKEEEKSLEEIKVRANLIAVFGFLFFLTFFSFLFLFPF